MSDTDTRQAPEPDEPETALCETATVDRAELAWSLDDDDREGDTHSKHPWTHAWGMASVIFTCAALLAISLFAWHVLHTRARPNESALPSKPPAPQPVSAAPARPPVTSTVTAPPASHSLRLAIRHGG